MASQTEKASPSDMALELADRVLRASRKLGSHAFHASHVVEDDFKRMMNRIQLHVYARRVRRDPEVRQRIDDVRLRIENGEKFEGARSREELDKLISEQL